MEATYFILKNITPTHLLKAKEGFQFEGPKEGNNLAVG